MENHKPVIKWVLIIFLAMVALYSFRLSCANNKIEKVENNVQNAREKWNIASKIALDASGKSNVSAQEFQKNHKTWMKIAGACMNLAQGQMLDALANSGIPFENEAARQEVESHHEMHMGNKEEYLATIRENLEKLKTKPKQAEDVARFQAAFDDALGNR